MEVCILLPQGSDFIPSKLSEILMGYRASLEASQEDYEEEYVRRVGNLSEYHKEWFSSLVRTYDQQNEYIVDRLKRAIKLLSGGDELTFAAVDGTCWKKPMEPYVVFFAAAYAVRGTISLTTDPPRVKYERWHSDQDTSIVAYVPVPYADLASLTRDEDIAADVERINLSSVHTHLMKLAEIYLLLDVLRSSSRRPRFLLWDQSLSSVFLRTCIQGTIKEIDKISLFGKRIGGIELTKNDAWVVFSHPYSTSFGIPSSRHIDVWRYVLYKLYSEGNYKIDIPSLAKEIGISEDNLKKKCDKILDVDPLAGVSLVNWDSSANTVSLSPQYIDSWDRCKQFLEIQAQNLFKGKQRNPMIYRFVSDIGEQRRYFSLTDIHFLTAIAIRALIESCWEHKAMLVGIAKDSSSTNFTKKYLGSLGTRDSIGFGEYGLIQREKPIPWTDRLCFEAIPVIDKELNAPWSTIEFDSVFMSLSYGWDQREEKERLAGIRGFILDPPERLFLRSLAQFFLKRDKGYPTQGHVIFIDRLTHSTFDSSNPTYRLEGDIWGEDRWGCIEPFCFLNNSVKNETQEIVIYLLNVLTKNLFPEVIGYPDPLHKADWGAKSLLRKVAPMIESSEYKAKKDPLKTRFRDLRARVKR